MIDLPPRAHTLLMRCVARLAPVRTRVCRACGSRFKAYCHNRRHCYGDACRKAREALIQARIRAARKTRPATATKPRVTREPDARLLLRRFGAKRKS